MRGLQFLQGLRLPPPNYNYNRRNETPGQLMAMNDRLDIVLLTSNNRLWHVNLKDLRNIDSGDADSGCEAGKYMVFPANEDKYTSSCDSFNIPEDIYIKSICFSPDGDAVCIWGSYYIGVLLIPQHNRKSPRLLDLSCSIVDDRQGCLCVLCVGGSRWRPTGIVLIPMSMKANASTTTIGSGMYKEDQLEEIFLPLYSQDSTGNEAAPVGFTLGRGTGWSSLALWILREDGNVQLMCPVLPPDTSLRQSHVLNLLRDADEELEIVRMKMEACGGHVEDLLSSLPTYDEEEEEENPNARQQKLLWDMAQTLSLRKRWIVSIFGIHSGCKGLCDEEESSYSTCSDDEGEKDDDDVYGVEQNKRLTAVQISGLRRASNSTQTWVRVVHPEALKAWPVTTQDKVSIQSDSPATNGPLGKACSIALLQGLPDAPKPSACKPAVLTRAYCGGHLDFILINGDVSPMWTASGGQDAVVVSDMDSVVLECLHLQGSMENDTSGPTASLQPLWPALLADPLETWALYAILPHGLISIKLEWASYLEAVISKLEKEFHSEGAQRRTLVEGRDCEDEYMGEERLSLRDALANRPKSAVFPVLSLVPLGGGKSQLDDEERIVGAIVTNNPYVGHVVIVRMASGDIEAINLTVWKYQADAQAKALERRLSRGTGGDSALVNSLQPFDHLIEPEIENLRSSLREHSCTLRAVVLPSDANEDLVKALLNEKNELDGGVVIHLEKLKERIFNRMEVLREIYTFQQKQLKEVSNQLKKAKEIQDATREELALVIETRSNLADRCAAILEGAQMNQPSMTRAESECLEDLKRWSAQASRWCGIVEQLRKKAEQELKQGGAPLATIQLDAQQEELVQTMLKAQSSRIDRSMQTAHHVTALLS